MKITFIGASHQVTGSLTLVEWKDDRFFIVDCGMEQGENDLVQAELPVPVSKIEYVFVTHAHIDHSGLLPLLYKNGFSGNIYSTPETQNLCSIMLADSAHIHETDAAYETKKNLRTGGPAVEPLYTADDVAGAMNLFHSCEYDKLYMIDEGLSVRFTDIGHLLGSAAIEFFLDDGVSRKLVCSGDIGNSNQPIIRNPKSINEADYLLIESTYGTRLHEITASPVPILTEILRKTFSRGGSVIIPSFAVGRTQELLYFFREIKQNHLLPEFESFPVYVDSPLANEATAIFLQCDPDCLDEKTHEIMLSGQNPIWFEGLHTTVSSEESKALNDDKSIPKVIIASGGMCEGGRIRHHLKHNLWDKRNTIMFAGYQAAGTLGRLIYDGAKAVKILGEEIDVEAEITLLPGISGHADRDGLLQWLSGFERKPSYVFVNHGDDESCTGFSAEIRNRFGIDASAPFSGSSFDMVKNEWIIITEPVYKENKQTDTKSSESKRIKDNVFTDLLNSVAELDQYAKGLEGHSNHELKELTARIRSLISDQV